MIVGPKVHLKGDRYIRYIYKMKIPKKIVDVLPPHMKDCRWISYSRKAPKIAGDFWEN